MIGAQRDRKHRPIILVASKAVDENERRLRGIAALQIGPGATIDHDAFLHQAGTPTQQPAAEGDEPAGEDEIGERQRDQRGDEEDEKEFHGVSFSTAPSRGEVGVGRSEEHTSELQSLMRISYAVFCLKKK